MADNSSDIFLEDIRLISKDLNNFYDDRFGLKDNLSWKYNEYLWHISAHGSKNAFYGDNGWLFIKSL